jgi:iron complex outermembrane recepter protein
MAASTPIHHFRTSPLALALLAASPFLSGLVMAADAPAGVESIVVSATRTATSLKAAPAAVSVIDREALQRLTLFTLDEALGRTAGVMNRRTKGFMETTPSLTMRGLSNSRDSLVLVDGIVQNDSRNGQVNWTMIDSENIERMEIVRGPFSSLYGGNALGGVVSIFTRVPERSGFSVKLGSGGSASSVAPEDFRDVALQGNYKATPTLNLALSYRLRETDGYPTTHVNVANTVISALPKGTTGAQPYTTNVGAASNLIGDMGDNWYEDESYSGRLSYTPDELTRLDLSISQSEAPYGYDEPNSYLRAAGTGTPTFANVTAATWLNGALFARGGDTQQRNVGLNFRTRSGEINYSLAVGYIDKSTTTVIAGLTAANAGHPSLSPVTFTGGDGRLSPAADSQRHSVDFQMDFTLGNSHTVVLGAAEMRGEVTEERWSLRSWANPSSRYFMGSDAAGKDVTRSLYVQDAWALNDTLTAYLGARQDWWQMSEGRARTFTLAGASGVIHYDAVKESAFSPKLSLVYRPTQATTLRGSVGSAFRAPNLFEFFGTAQLGGNQFVGNPDLQPEALVSWELGLDHSFASGINAILTVYRSYVDDRIATQTVAGVSRPANVAEARIKGAELELNGPLPLGFDWSVNYTLTDSEVTRDPVATVVGRQLPHSPEKMYNLALNWRHADWLVAASHYHQSKRFTNVGNTDVVTGVPGSTDAFTLTDVKASYEVSESISTSIGINNVFDEEFNQFYRSPGRFWFAELRLQY